jgi:hypothetical protein
MRTYLVSVVALSAGLFSLVASCCGSTPACTHSCLNAGLTQCFGFKVQTCTEGSDGCLAWSSATTCPMPQQFCDTAQNNCVACANPCPAAGNTQCSGTQVQTCATDPRGCLAWGASVDCSGDAGTEFCDPAQQKCASCNTCPQAGATQCSGSQIQTCTADTQGCLGWSIPAPCATAGEICDPAQQRCASCC